MNTLTGEKSAQAAKSAVEAGEGILRLAPTWVPRSFLQPGRRLKLHPQDYYALGKHRGGIDERWFGSTTPAANDNRNEDEGLSYVVHDGARFTLKDAVDALGGAPGVFSARYSPEGTDEANWRRLWAELRGVPQERRAARFVCVVVAHAPSGAELAAQGAWEGRIALEPSGDNGFGYDPVFLDPELGRTAACHSREEKNARSHRGKALAALLARWPEFWDKV